MPPWRNYAQEEHFHPADEHGVQGRFNEKIGQFLSLASTVEGLNFLAGDAKSYRTTYTKIPDFSIRIRFGPLLVVGEMKPRALKYMD